MTERRPCDSRLQVKMWNLCAYEWELLVFSLKEETQ